MKNQRLASIITGIHLLGEIWYNHLSAYAKEIAMNIIKIEFAKERIIPASGLAVAGAILGKSDFVKKCNHSLRL